jgi:hypothetical protein
VTPGQHDREHHERDGRRERGREGDEKQSHAFSTKRRAGGGAGWGGAAAAG